MSTATTKTIYGVYGDDDELMKGVHAFRDKGIEIAEVYTPFPVHGLDKALGLKKTRISDAAWGYAVYGLTIGALVTWYTMNRDWPQNIGGKPAFDWAHNMPAFVVPMFELMVFSAAHMMSLTFLIRNKMFLGAKAQNPDPRTTDDKFMIEFQSNEVDVIKDILIQTGAEEVSVKESQEETLQKIEDKKLEIQEKSKLEEITVENTSANDSSIKLGTSEEANKPVPTDDNKSTDSAQAKNINTQNNDPKSI